MTLVDKPFREKFNVDRLTGRKEPDQFGFTSSMRRHTKRMITRLEGMYVKCSAYRIPVSFVKDMLIPLKLEMYIDIPLYTYTLILAPFEAVLLGSISDKTAFCLGEWQGILVNDECNSWYT